METVNQRQGIHDKRTQEKDDILTDNILKDFGLSIHHRIAINVVEHAII